MAKLTTKESRNLVVCCDGTSNEIGIKLSNVLKLYRIAEKSDDQLVYYSPGIGTIAMPDSWGAWRQKLSSGLEMATGRGLDRDVLNAYCFLCRNYRPGDRIFLFGFSRGAYTVRVVAGLIYLIGLLREHQVNFAGYALRAYKTASETDDFDVAWTFNRIVRAQRVPIHFLGVWDTVSSVIVPGRGLFSGLRLEELPYTSKNPAVGTFRHAIAIDEFRRMFRIKRWEDPQDFKPNPFSKEDPVPEQKIKQVWFAGCHSDVGGGFVEDHSALAKFPLKWMVDEAKHAGLKVRTSMINHLVLGLPREGARLYQKPDPKGELHISLHGFWNLFEPFPKSARLKDWPGRRALLGMYLPLGEPRFIPDASVIHESVLDRMKFDPTYRPVNVPPEGKRAVEPWNGTVSTETEE